MEDLFAEIAEYLRRQRRPRPAAGGSPASTPPAVPAPARSTSRVHLLTCRFCGRRIVAGEGTTQFHDHELIEAVSCAPCHRRRLDEEAAGPAWASAWNGWYSASGVIPPCKRCGRRIGEVVERLVQLRLCVACAQDEIDRREAGAAGPR